MGLHSSNQIWILINRSKSIEQLNHLVHALPNDVWFFHWSKLHSSIVSNAGMRARQTCVSKARWQKKIFYFFYSGQFFPFGCGLVVNVSNTKFKKSWKEESKIPKSIPIYVRTIVFRHGFSISTRIDKIDRKLVNFFEWHSAHWSIMATVRWLAARATVRISDTREHRAEPCIANEQALACGTTRNRLCSWMRCHSGSSSNLSHSL